MRTILSFNGYTKKSRAVERQKKNNFFFLALSKNRLRLYLCKGKLSVKIHFKDVIFLHLSLHFNRKLHKVPFL